MKADAAVVASLPMYDWPEVRDANDALWACLRDSLRDAGFPAPETLSRDSEKPCAVWTDPSLVIGQTCGLPLTSTLLSHVRVVGTPAYDIDCGAGCYYSVVIVRRDNDVAGLEDLRGSRFAYNSEDSLSGYATLAYRLREMTTDSPFFGDRLHTGAHRASIRAVAEGKADVASIDAVAWRLALRHEKAAEDIRVLALTDSLPGLPFISARRPDWRVERLHLAVVEAMASLDTHSADALLLTGFAQTDETDYAPLKERVRVAMERPL